MTDNDNLADQVETQIAEAREREKRYARYAREDREAGSDFNFETGFDAPKTLWDAVQGSKGARRVQEARSQWDAAVRAIVREELKQVLEDVSHADACGLNVFQYVTDHLQTRMNAAAEKAREGR